MSGWNKRWPVFIPKKTAWVIILLFFLLVCTLVGDVSAVETNKPGEDPTAFDEEPPPDRPMYFKLDEHPVSINTSTNEEGDSLVDQFDQMTEWGIISTKFKPSESEWDIQAADDFVVPAAEGNWKVTSIEASGFFVSGDLKLNNPDVEIAHVYFYMDAGGVLGR
jgi:hypothetical protein